MSAEHTNRATHTNRAGDRRTSLLLATLLAGSTLAIGGGITTAGAEEADFTYPSAIDPSSITITTNSGSSSDEAKKWDWLRIDAEWSVPTGAAAGETFGLTLPPEFGMAGAGTFSISAPEAPDTAVANCTVSDDDAPVVTCTLTDHVDALQDVAGDLWFWVEASEVTENDGLDFVIDGVVTVVPLPGGGIGVPGNEPPVTSLVKDSFPITASGSMTWRIYVPGSQFAGQETLTISDALKVGAGFAPHEIDPGSFSFAAATGDDELTDVDPSEYSVSVSDDLLSYTFTFAGPIPADARYRLMYRTTATGPLVLGQTFGNSANVDGSTIEHVTTVEQQGGGNGTGTPPTTPTPTATPTPTPTPTATPTPTPTATPTPTPTPTATPTPTPTPTATPTPTPTPDLTPTPTNASHPPVTPTITPAPESSLATTGAETLAPFAAAAAALLLAAGAMLLARTKRSQP